MCTTTFSNFQNDAWAPLCKKMLLNLHPTITHHASIMKCTNVQLLAKKYVHLLHKLHWVKWKYVTCQNFRLLMKSFKLVNEVCSVYYSCNLIYSRFVTCTWISNFEPSSMIIITTSKPLTFWCNRYIILYPISKLTYHIVNIMLEQNLK